MNLYTPELFFMRITLRISGAFCQLKESQMLHCWQVGLLLCTTVGFRRDKKSTWEHMWAEIFSDEGCKRTLGAVSRDNICLFGSETKGLWGGISKVCHSGRHWARVDMKWETGISMVFSWSKATFTFVIKYIRWLSLLKASSFLKKKIFSHHFPTWSWL